MLLRALSWLLSIGRCSAARAGSSGSRKPGEARPVLGPQSAGPSFGPVNKLGGMVVGGNVEELSQHFAALLSGGTGSLVQRSPLGFMVAFGAGIVSFLSPCVLPLVPSYLSMMSGVGVADLPGEQTRRARGAVVDPAVRGRFQRRFRPSRGNRQRRVRSFARPQACPRRHRRCPDRRHGTGSCGCPASTSSAERAPLDP